VKIQGNKMAYGSIQIKQVVFSFQVSAIPPNQNKKAQKNNGSHVDVWGMGREKYGSNQHVPKCPINI